jgi:hypothetical protein
MQYSQEETWVTGATSGTVYETYNAKIWTPCDDDEVWFNPEYFIDKGYRSFACTKGASGGDKSFVSDLSKDELEIALKQSGWIYFTLYYCLTEHSEKMKKKRDGQDTAK